MEKKLFATKREVSHALIKTAYIATGWAFIVVAVVMLAGCSDSKTLTPSTARRLLEKRARAKGDATIDYSPTAALIGHKTFIDYQQEEFSGATPEGALHRLLRAGLAGQTVGKSSYPNLTGVYEGRGSIYESFAISMRPGSPLIDGTYKYDICGGRISGTLHGDGSVTINSLGTGAWGECSTTLSRLFRVQQTNEGINLVPDELNTHGFYGKGPSGAPIELTTYEYTFLPKFLESVDVAGKTLRGGPFQIDSVTNLLLGETATFATASFSWHVNYNAAGQAITGVAENHGTTHVTFRKQPDGTWVLPD